jgi:hypothetical protein
MAEGRGGRTTPPVRPFAGIVALLALGTSLLVPAVPGHAAEPVIRPFAGGLGSGQATNVAQTPEGMAVVGDRLFLVDGPLGTTELPAIDSDYPGTVRSVDLATGTESVVAGTGFDGFSPDGRMASRSSFGDLKDVAGTRDGTLYLAEAAAGRIRRISPSGVVTTLAGNGTHALTGDGGPAASASLSWPLALATGPRGDCTCSTRGACAGSTPRARSQPFLPCPRSPPNQFSALSAPSPSTETGTSSSPRTTPTG